MEAALLVCLILLNGVFAMSELALATARKSRLQVMVSAGDRRAKAAMKLQEDPTGFLSTIQIGITSIGILNGIVGEAAFAGPLADILVSAGIPAGAASVFATATVVLVITYLTIVFGELVPKRVGQLHPETISRLIARPMNVLAGFTRPFVKLLSLSTHGTLRLLGIRQDGGPKVTEEEINALLEEGSVMGVIEDQEHRMVRNVFRLDDRLVSSMMIPRDEIEWLDVAAATEQVYEVVARSPHSRYPVCRGGLDDVVGVVAVRELYRRLGAGEAFSIQEALEPAVFVPETQTGMELLTHFRDTGVHVALVVDEYGEIQGLVSKTDIIEAIAGEFNPGAGDTAWAVQRADGSWLLDGLMPSPELKDRLMIHELPDEDRDRYNTLAGMIVLLLGRLPQTTDTVEWAGWRFEVVDLDGRRIDKVLAAQLSSDAPTQNPQDLDDTG